MDKDFLLRLVDAIEKLYLENMGFRSLFKVHRQRLPPQHEIDELMEFAKTDPRVGDVVREQFEPVRAGIRANETLEQVLQEFLRVVPPQKDMN